MSTTVIIRRLLRQLEDTRKTGSSWRLESSNDSRFPIIRYRILIISFIFDFTPKIHDSSYPEISMEMYLEAEFTIIRSLLGKRKTITTLLCRRHGRR